MSGLRSPSGIIINVSVFFKYGLLQRRIIFYRYAVIDVYYNIDTDIFTYKCLHDLNIKYCYLIVNNYCVNIA